MKEAEQAIYVSDITLSPDIRLITDPTQLIVKVSEVALEKEEEKVVVVVEAEAEAEAKAKVEPEQQSAK